MDYKEKLKQFNSTDKYKNELKFLNNLVGRYGQHYDNVLDYGAGLGTCAKYIQDNSRKDICVDMYDKEQWNEKANYITKEELEDGSETYEMVYFMHSFAHIQFENLDFIKKLLFPFGNKIVIVFTPNKDWLQNVDSTNYNPDTTDRKSVV